MSAVGPATLRRALTSDAATLYVPFRAAVTVGSGLVGLLLCLLTLCLAWNEPFVREADTPTCSQRAWPWRSPDPSELKHLPS